MGVRVCEGICHQGVKAHGETVRAEDSICEEVGGRGLTRFMLGGQKISCHSVVGLAQLPSNQREGAEIW